MHDDAGPDLQSIANMACGRISGKVPWAPTCIDRSGSVAGRDALSSAPAHATGISVRLQGAVDGRPFDDVVIKAESARGSPAVLELRAKRTIDFTGGSHATRRACKAPYDSRPRPPCSCRDHDKAKTGAIGSDPDIALQRDVIDLMPLRLKFDFVDLILVP